MLELLNEVESGAYDAVLVMDIDWLGYGDKVDQGLIERAFRESGTKIITPRNVYDPNDERDEEYMEFESFMARRELKLINRRLQRGRVPSVEGELYRHSPSLWLPISQHRSGTDSWPPSEQAPIVPMIFDWYTDQDPIWRMGSNKITILYNQLYNNPKQLER
jgi:site-specific DNA recombinase